jgi:hypothetical protein
VKGVVSSVRAGPVNNKEKIEDVTLDLYNLPVELYLGPLD